MLSSNHNCAYSFQEDSINDFNISYVISVSSQTKKTQGFKNEVHFTS